MKWLSKPLLLLVVLAAAGAGYWYWNRPAQAEGEYQTAEIHKGTVEQIITATGTVEPEEVVDVGAQVGGLVLELGRDPQDPSKSVDFNTMVDQGTVLAKIDTTLYQSDIDQAQAAYASQVANLQRSTADLLNFKARLMQAENDWNRAQRIGAGEALSRGEFDGFQATFLAANASVRVAEAAIKQAEASVDQANATLKRTERNLVYTTIVSPVKGVIIDRKVNIGQTVNSSMSAPSLFLIAKDLTKMQVWVAVNEADVGHIKPGMPVTFTADSFPGRTFQGMVDKVRLNAAMSQNVVTFTVEVNTENADGTLLPYLTANVRFLVEKHDDVLLIPNAALRWRPRAEAAAAASADASQSANAGGANRGGGRRGGGAPQLRGARQVTLYILENGEPKPVKVRTGLTDLIMTEVSGDIKEGDQVIIGDGAAGPAASASSAQTTNPFAPQFNNRGGQGNRGGR